ncbi:hypothetical protein VUR80DRAFT_7032 [Thermomyces stellatus]
MEMQTPTSIEGKKPWKSLDELTRSRERLASKAPALSLRINAVELNGERYKDENKQRWGMMQTAYLSHVKSEKYNTDRQTPTYNGNNKTRPMLPIRYAIARLSNPQ